MTAQIGNGGQVDVFIAKFDASLSELIYAVRIGGSGIDAAQALAVDGDGSAYVTGYTGSSDFPVTERGWRPQTKFLGTSFVVKLNREGTDLAYSTYFPVTNARAITVDVEGRAWVAGADSSGLLPATEDAPQRERKEGICLTSRNGTPFGCTDGFLARLDAMGSQLEYATYLGGTGEPFVSYETDPSGAGGMFVRGSDRINAIAIGAGGVVLTIGVTSSRDFPVTEDAIKKELDSADGFLVRLDPSGRRIEYSTLLGGASGDSIEHVAVDSAGRPHVLGVTGRAGGMSSIAGIFVDMGRLFLARLSVSGTELEYWREIPPIAGSVLELGFALDLAGEAHYSRRAFSDSTARTELGKLDTEGGAGGASLVPTVGARLALGPNGAIYLAGQAVRPLDGSIANLRFFGDGPGGALLVKVESQPDSSRGSAELMVTVP
jgi:hypothetical protein